MQSQICIQMHFYGSTRRNESCRLGSATAVTFSWSSDLEPVQQVNLFECFKSGVNFIKVKHLEVEIVSDAALKLCQYKLTVTRTDV